MLSRYLGALTACIFVLGTTSHTTAANADQPPNILLLIADDLGIDLISTYTDASVPAEYPPDYTVPSTPTIEGLADTGVIFDNAWSAPSCSPTRATMLTGQHGFRSGVNWPIGGPFTPFGTPSQLDVDNPYLLPKLLKQAGYATALTGKWHMTSGDPDALDDPGQAGFDNSWGPQRGAVGNFYDWTQLINEVDELTGDIFVTQQSITTYATTEDVNRATAWITDQAAAGKPWFLWGAFIAPHLPAGQIGHFPPASLIPASRTDGVGVDDCNGPPGNLPADASDQLIRNCYEAGLEALDTEIARLLSTIDDLGQLDNTVIIFLGDNGTDNPVVLDPVDSEHAKNTLYQQGVHVPLIINGPSTSDFARRVNGLVHTVDLYKTILDVAGIRLRQVVPPSVRIDSRSVEHTLRSNRRTRRLANFSQLCVPFSAPGFSLNPAVLELPPHDGQTIRDRRYKLITRTPVDDKNDDDLTNDEYLEGETVLEFYDLENDPYELDNLLDAGLTLREQIRFKLLAIGLKLLTGGETCSDWRAGAL